MEFAVVFQGVSIPEREVGLDDIFFVREKVGKNIPLEDIEEYTKKFNDHKIVIPVSEDFVRKHYSLFEKRNKLRVEVNSFRRFFYKAVGDKGEGRSPRYFIYYELDEKAIFDAWEKADCPEEM